MKNTTIQACYALFILFSFYSTELFAQNSKLSPYTRLFYQEAMTYKAAIYKDATSKTKAFQKLKEEYPVRNDEKRGEYIHGLMEIVQDQLDYDELRKAGVKIAIVRDNIWLFTIPLDKIMELEEVKGIVYVDIDQYLEPTLDEALSSAKVTDVHSMVDLEQAYTGKGVTVAIIDKGFDYTHPTFRDSSGNLRIKEVWDMELMGGNPPNIIVEPCTDIIDCDNDSLVNTPPGTLLDSDIEIFLQEQSQTVDSHGTHVAGIAAGRGSLINDVNTYRGVAYESDILLVNSSSMCDIIYGLEYLSNYASSNDTRVIVNLSLGLQGGPKDGNSIWTDEVDYYVKEKELIIIGSAGNYADNPVHIFKPYSNENNIIGTFIQGGNYSEGYSNNVKGDIQIWGEINTSFGAQINIGTFDTDNNFTICKSTEIIFSNGECIDTDLDCGFFDYNISIKFCPNQYYIENKPNMTISIDNYDEDTDKWVQLKVFPYNTDIHMWGIEGKNGTVSFSNQNVNMENYLNGDSNYTISDGIGTAKKVITVGAYNTKSSYININGDSQTPVENSIDGEISLFSSKGPTVDGRVKPEIVAPGNTIVSSVNRYDPAYQENGDYVDDVVAKITEDNIEWKYAAIHGTSQAAPIVTGIVALMLEANPDLNADAVKCILTSTAYTDNFTGEIPPEGSNTWGWGKVHAHNAVKKALEDFKDTDAPTNLSISNILPSKVTLNWEDNSSCESNFFIEISEGDNFNYQEYDRAEMDRTHLQIDDLQPNTLYYARIIAKKGTIETGYSNEIAFTTMFLPNPPTNLVATVLSNNSVQLDWIDNSDDEIGFFVWRSIGDDQHFVRLNDVVVEEITYTDSGLPSNTHVYYYIEALSQDGVLGSNSNITHIITSTNIEPVSTIDYIEVFFDTDPGFGNGIPLAFVPTDNVSIDEILDTDNLPNGVHTLYIRAKDEYGNWSLTNSRLFVKNTNYQPQTANLVELEYFFGEDPGFGNGTKIPLPLKEKVNIAFLAENTGLEDGEYLFSLRAKDEFGRYSLVQMKTITIDNSLTFYTVGATVLHDKGEGVTTLITGANVIFEGGGGCLTNINGQCEISLPEGWEGEINATALGYVFNGSIANEPEQPLNSDIDIILTMEKDPNYNPCEMDLAVMISYPVNHPESAIGSNIKVNGKINNDFYAQATKSVLLTEGFDSQSNNVIIIEIEDCLTGEGSLMAENVLKQEVAKNENSIALNSNEIEANISPNPSKGRVNIQFSIEEDTPVSLYIFDMNGRKIANLIEGDIHTPNKYQLLFDGRYLKKGAYYCRLETKSCFKTMQFVVQ